MELDREFMIQLFPLLLKGIPVTLGLTAVSLLLAAPLAFLMAHVRVTGRTLAGRAAALYISFVRGTPMVLQILLLYSLLPSLLNQLVQAAGSDFNVFERISPFWYACAVFTLNTAAVLSEVFRSSLLSVGGKQMEAGLSIGLSRFQTYTQIIIPQALVSAIPNICNITVDLVKGTSLAFLMSVKDVLAVAKIEAAYGYNYVEAYLDVFLVYIVLCTVIQILYRYAEKHFGRFRPVRE